MNINYIIVNDLTSPTGRGFTPVTKREATSIATSFAIITTVTIVIKLCTNTGCSRA